MLRSLPSARSPRHTFLSSFRSFSSHAYDLLVIGGGPGGYVAAIKAAQLGMKTACIESRGALGGTCLNVGCIPSKALLHATHMFHHAQHDFQRLGIEVSNVKMNFSTMMHSKEKAVKVLTGGIESLFKKNKVTYLKGFGRIVDKHNVSVAFSDVSKGSETFEAKHILIATGSEVAPLDSCPVNNEEGRIVDSTGALSLPKLPKHLVVVGAGVIGLELGSVYKRLGSNVTVIEYLDRVCPGLDRELGRAFGTILEKQGMKFSFSTKVTGSKIDGERVILTTENAKGGDSKTLECDVVLVATGRRPFTRGLGLEELGISMDHKQRIQVDAQFRTNIPNVFAIGDVIAGPMLAHKAEEEGIAAVEIMAGKHGHVNYNTIPGVIYTYPEVACVGKTEEQLQEEKIPYNVGKFPMIANSRARAIGETDGFVKVLAHKDDDQILGIHIMTSNAGEMISEGVLGMEYGAASEDIARTCHAHPTLSEALKEACNAAYDKPINF